MAFSRSFTESSSLSIAKRCLSASRPVPVITDLSAVRRLCSACSFDFSFGKPDRNTRLSCSAKSFSYASLASLLSLALRLRSFLLDFFLSLASRSFLSSSSDNSFSLFRHTSRASKYWEVSDLAASSRFFAAFTFSSSSAFLPSSLFPDFLLFSLKAARRPSAFKCSCAARLSASKDSLYVFSHEPTKNRAVSRLFSPAASFCI